MQAGMQLQFPLPRQFPLLQLLLQAHPAPCYQPAMEPSRKPDKAQIPVPPQTPELA